MDKLNLYSKLSKIRVEINVSKTGFNKFGKYNYYEIDNIYKQAKTLFMKYGIFTTFSLEYSKENGMHLGILNIYDCDSDKVITTRIDSPTNLMKGSSPCQQVGANVTYQCKYLYMSLLMLDDGANDPDFNNKHEDTKEDNKAEYDRKVALHHKVHHEAKEIAYGDDDDDFI